MTAITALFFLFLGVAAILLLLATAALHRHSGPSNSADGLSIKDLKKLPQFKFSRRSNPEAEADCVVCLEGIRQGQWCRKLIGCGHVFHRKCVDAWLVKVSACPVCRTRVRLGSGTLLEDRPLWGFGWTNESRVWLLKDLLTLQQADMYLTSLLLEVASPARKLNDVLVAPKKAIDHREWDSSEMDFKVIGNVRGDGEGIQWGGDDSDLGAMMRKCFENVQ
ncbi:hypothetical protein GH714_006409 [Hevea brasiliensis]|uniref:RING-type domain-containing protein n=1 Tax=Hevea brasiliensis TaxID=3981 RepID=A0A6A6MX51_HEVBR|nr:hypothetical protein GH714_006409 [Hevea brasiliensis]